MRPVSTKNALTRANAQCLEHVSKAIGEQEKLSVTEVMLTLASYKNARQAAASSARFGGTTRSGGVIANDGRATHGVFLELETACRAGLMCIKADDYPGARVCGAADVRRTDSAPGGIGKGHNSRKKAPASERLAGGWVNANA